MKFNTNALKKDINLYMRTFAQVYINKAIKLLETYARDCVTYFYNDYNPLVYKRTYSFFDNSVSSKISKLGNGTGYSGYVDLMSDVSGGNEIYKSNELTDEAIREENWTGGRFNKAPTTNPSPVFYLMDFYYSKQFNNPAIMEARRIARNQSYSCIKKR